MRVHVHVGGRRVASLLAAPRPARTRDLSGPEYDDLVERLMVALSDIRAITGDEEPGHPFHGNQYTGGLGAKPQEVKEKGVKSGVHELLSSGHPFSMEELQKITGATTIKQISDALAMLKNPKYAGSKGTLEIVKTPEGFKVKPKEQPALPPHLQALAEKLDAGQPSATVTEIDPYPPGLQLSTLGSGEDLGPAEAQHEAYAKGPSVAPPAPMSKEEASAKYEKQKLDDMLDLQAAAKSTAAEHAEAVALQWKEKKAKAMAQWKADTTGQNQASPKPQQVYAADLELVKDLAQGAHVDDAFKEWKKNTAAEKAGNFPAKAAVNPMPKPAAPPAPPKAEAHAPAFEPVKDYVPADHAHVSAADFAPKQGASNGHFAKQLQSFKSSLSAGHPDAVQNKLGVQAALEKRLQASKAFQSLNEQYKKKGTGWGSLAAQLISSWASTSGDSHPVSIANQISVREAFGMDPAQVSQGNMGGAHGGAHDDEKIFEQAAAQLGCGYDTPEARATFKAGLRDFALAQYHNTQDHLKQLGISEVCVVRGMKISHGAHSGAVEGDVKLQPASSFTANFGTAAQFASGQTLYFSKVPASQVLSSYVTGFGCSNEHEVVVLAHPGMKAVRTPSGKASNMTEAADYIHTTLGKGPSKAEVAAGKTAEPAKPMSKAKAEMVIAGAYPIPSHVVPAQHAHNISELLANGKLDDLKAYTAKLAGKKMPKTKEFLKLATQHLEAKAALAHHAAATAPKAAKPAAKAEAPEVPNVPKPPHNGEIVAGAYESALAGDLPALGKALEELGGWASPASVDYVKGLQEHVQQHNAKAGAGAAIAKAQSTPHVPHQGPAPAGHALHSHYDPAEYEGWVKKGLSTHQLGKKLAMKKFMAKKGATA